MDSAPLSPRSLDCERGLKGPSTVPHIQKKPGKVVLAKVI